MNKLQKALGMGMLALTLNGCSDIPQKYLEGKVTKESGTACNIVESSGALFGNESVKFGEPTYILTVETKQGKYTINVIEYRKSILALAQAIEVGDSIRFALSGYDVSPCFSEDRVGSNLSMDIVVLGK